MHYFLNTLKWSPKKTEHTKEGQSTKHTILQQAFGGETADLKLRSRAFDRQVSTLILCKVFSLFKFIAVLNYPANLNDRISARYSFQFDTRIEPVYGYLRKQVFQAKSSHIKNCLTLQGYYKAQRNHNNNKIEKINKTKIPNGQHNVWQASLPSLKD